MVPPPSEETGAATPGLRSAAPRLRAHRDVPAAPSRGPSAEQAEWHSGADQAITPQGNLPPSAAGLRPGSRRVKTGGPGRRTVKSADDLLREARASLPRRPSPAEALAAQANGALLIDIRGDDQRRAAGLIPGALLIPRNSLEWRCDPAGRWRHPAITSRNQHLILICQEGFQSSLAASILQRLGLVNATDLDGGFAAWAAAGLPRDPAGSQ
jgi:rhodanese-related sulfurtransferase